MKEFTEKHHAFIAASFYALLTERFHDRGKAAFIHATQRYAEQRGARMAQRAIRDGQPLNFKTYLSYGEWASTQTAKDEGCENQVETLSLAPDFEMKITRCPWAAQFKEMGLQNAGVIYCTHVDRSIVRGFNPALVYEVPQSMNDHGYCIQIARNADLDKDHMPVKHPEYLRGFDYHCGHIYKTFSSVAAAIFGAEGQAVSTEVLNRFAQKYGSEMADVLVRYYDEDFDII
jgi:hypothetical protein